MSGLEVFLDVMPGETRGVIARNGRFVHLLIERDGDVAQQRLGARCVGRVTRIEPGLGAAFLDLGAGEPVGFLPLGKGVRLTEGEVLEVAVTAEPREAKGPTLRRIGAGQGAPRLLAAGPDVTEILAALAPGVEARTGIEAVDAALAAEEAALSAGVVRADVGLDLRVERTRALVAVDVDHAAQPGRDARRARDRVNRAGLIEAARLIQLKRWGGLVCVDLVGGAMDGPAVTAWAREAFAAEPNAAFGPVSRFGMIQLTLPWHRRPIEEVLYDGAGRRLLQTRALDAVRRLNRALLADTASPRIAVACAPEEAEVAVPLVAGLGPRASVAAEVATPPGHAYIVST